ncbi:MULTISPECIES: hypothetical protein [unclassified Blastococcus]
MADQPCLPARSRPRTGGASSGRRVAAAHVHWFRRVGQDPFSSATLYACRCGEVRAGF